MECSTMSEAKPEDTKDTRREDATPGATRSDDDAEAGRRRRAERPAGDLAGRLLAWPASAARRYDGAFEGAMSRVREIEPALLEERAAARRRARRLLGQPPARRRLLVDNHSGYGGWFLAALLLDEAERCVGLARRGAVPHQALRLTALAVDALAASRHDPEIEPLVEDLRSRAWRVGAEGHRRLGDLEAAAGALAEARRHLRRGSGEPLERALLAESRGNLLAALGRRPRAEALLLAAARRFRRLGDSHLEGRARVTAGLVVAAGANAAAGSRGGELLRRGLLLLDPARDGELAATAARRLSEIVAAAPLPERLRPRDLSVSSLSA